MAEMQKCPKCDGRFDSRGYFTHLKKCRGPASRIVAEQRRKDAKKPKLKKKNGPARPTGSKNRKRVEQDGVTHFNFCPGCGMNLKKLKAIEPLF